LRRVYAVIPVISSFFRNFVISEIWPIIIPMTLTLGSTSTKINVSFIIAEGILWAMSFSMTGLVYTSGSFPALGAILYLVFYALNTFVLSSMSSTGWAWYSFLLAGILYSVIIYEIFRLKRKIFGF